MKTLTALLLFMVLACLALTPLVGALSVPVGVKEQEVVALYLTDKSTGNFRDDGNDETFDYCIESGCFWNPQPGDRLNVEYSQGWRLTFWNVGEMGGEAKQVAKLEKITVFYSAGEIVSEVLPPETEDSLKIGITYGGIVSAPAAPDDVLEPYVSPKYTFSLGFTGGPAGVFYEMDGARQHPSGKALRGDVITAEDGLYYVQMSDAFTARLKIDDPEVFRGFRDAPENRQYVVELPYVQGFYEWSGEVYVETPDGDAYVPGDPNSAGEKVYAGCTIKTGSDSYAAVMMNHYGTIIVIGPNSQMRIQAPEMGFFDTANGRLLMKVMTNFEAIMKTGHMPITMNQAVAGRKGTAAVFIEEEGISSIRVLEGEMYLRSNATGESKDVLPGQALSATDQGLSEFTQFDVEAELQAWEQLTSKEAIDKVREMMAQDQAASVSEGEELASPPDRGLPVLWFAGALAGVVLVVALFVVRRARTRPTPRPV